MSKESVSELIDALTSARFYLESSRAGELQAAVQDPGASSERFLSFLSPSELGAIILHDREKQVPFKGFSSLPLRLKEDAEALLALTHEKVPGISKHPGLRDFFAEWAKTLSMDEASPSKSEDISNSENRSGRIAGIAAAHFWGGDVGNLDPFINLRLRDNEGALLFEAMASFHEMTFVTSGMLEILNSMTERLITGHEKKVVTLNFLPETRQWLSQIYQQAHTLEQALGKLLPVEPLPSTEAEQPS